MRTRRGDWEDATVSSFATSSSSSSSRSRFSSLARDRGEECGGLCLPRSCRAPLVVRGLEEQDPLAVPGELRALTAKEFREQRTLRRACTSPLDGEVALRALGALGRDMSSTAARPKAQLRASVGVNYCRTSGQQADKETRIVLVAVDIVVVVVAIVEIYTVQPHNV